MTRAWVVVCSAPCTSHDTRSRFSLLCGRGARPIWGKTREQVRGYIDEIIAFMIKKQVDAIVIACNTATSVATKEYRSQFPLPIVGMEPAVKKAVEEYADRPGRILVAATPITIQGDKLHTWWTGWISVTW